MRNRQAVAIANLTKLRIVRAILRRTLFIDARELRDQETAIKSIDRLIAATERKAEGGR